MAKEKQKKTIASYPHAGEKRKNIPTAELQSVVDNDTKTPKPRKYPRNTGLDPQIVWRGKDGRDWSDLVVHAPKPPPMNPQEARGRPGQRRRSAY
jgi:adenine-specific DNA-methyltransferase